MIIYKESISQFIDDCYSDIIVPKILASIKERRGFKDVSQKEKESWKTLKKLAKQLQDIQPSDCQYILLEFVIRDSRKRIDVMIVGKDEKNRKNISIIELKGWSKIELIDNSELLNPNVSYAPCEHPSYEAYDYLYILKNMYSGINEFNIDSLSFLPNYENSINVLRDYKYKDIVSICNTYSNKDTDDLINKLKTTFNHCIDMNEVNKLDDLEYKPSKNFKQHLINEFNDVRLIGSQSETFKKIKYYIDLFSKTNKKFLFIISGGAGSGKTVIAFKLMIYLRTLEAITYLILPGPEFRDAIKKTFGEKVAKEFIRGADSFMSADYVIIDEAHKATGRDTAKIYYNRIFDNIGKSIITLIDDQQVVNKKGITKSELKDIANSKGYQIIECDLQEQFRNGGDVSYTDWLKKILFNYDNNQEFFINEFYDFDILSADKFNDKYKSMYDKHNVRLVSFWTQTWDLNALTPTVKIGNQKYIWNPNWQWLSKYNQNGHKTTKELNKLCNLMNFNKDKKGYEYVGYFNTVQGYEFDYIFVHVPKLFYLNDDNEIDVNLDELYLREMSSQIWSTKSIKDSIEKQKKNNLNKLYFLNRLFINLTRGTEGTYVYIEDEKLREYFRSHFKDIRRN